MQISFFSKVTRLHKAVTVVNNTSLCSTILVVFLEIIPVEWAEISPTFMNSPQNLSRLPGSYEEALILLMNYKYEILTQHANQ